MGRIMRAKENPNGEYNAFFYTLASNGTKELEYGRLRQKILADQGFPFEVVLAEDLNYSGIKIKELDENGDN